VVSHDKEIQRAGQFGRLTGVRRNLLSSCEAVGITGCEPGTERASVHGERGVQVCVSKERPRGEVTPGIRRIGRLCREHFFDLGLIGCTGHTDVALLRGHHRQRETSGCQCRQGGKTK